jgi:hypothetical protein
MRDKTRLVLRRLYIPYPLRFPYCTSVPSIQVDFAATITLAYIPYDALTTITHFVTTTKSCKGWQLGG